MLRKNPWAPLGAAGVTFLGACQVISGLGQLDDRASSVGSGGAGPASSSGSTTVVSSGSAGAGGDATTASDSASSGTSPPVCGDGAIESDEECDDENTTPSDGCSATCLVECDGEGVARNPEQPSCWILFEVERTWLEAERACEAIGPGSRLATPATQVEVDALAAALEPTQHTIGARQIPRDGEWSWVSDDEWDYADHERPWQEPEPNDARGTQDCVVMVGASFDDFWCDLPRPFICEVDGAFALGGCGDGVPRGDEECDDGNTDDGDGCSAACTIECGLAGAVPDTRLGRCYRFSEGGPSPSDGDQRTPAAAAQACAALGPSAQLAVLPDEAAIENAKMIGLPEGFCPDGSCAWLGATACAPGDPTVVADDACAWLDGSTWNIPGGPPPFGPWAVGEPTAGQECLRLDGGTASPGLHSVDCTVVAPYLCEVRPLEEVTPD